MYPSNQALSKREVSSTQELLKGPISIVGHRQLRDDKAREQGSLRKHARLYELRRDSAVPRDASLSQQTHNLSTH